MLGVLYNLLFPSIFKDSLVIQSVHFYFRSLLAELVLAIFSLFFFFSFFFKVVDHSTCLFLLIP